MGIEQSFTKDISTVNGKPASEINMEEVLSEAIHNLVTLSHKNFSDPRDVVTCGLSYFMQMNFFCAPDEETAEELALDIINFYKEIQNANHKSTSA